MHSLLDDLSADDIVTEPFPHLVVQPAMTPALYRRFAARVPGYEDVSFVGNRMSNARFACPAKLMLASPRFDSLWHDFCRLHASRAFLRQALALFAAHLPHCNPALAARLPALLEQSIDLVDFVDNGDAPLLLDARLEVNTPVHGAASSVRRAHLDTPNRLYSLLFYLRAPEDESTGGDLQLFRWRDGRPRDVTRHEIPDDEVELVKTVPYAANRMVMFPNSPHALHGVSPRHPTPHQRSYLFVTAELRQDLF